MTKLKVLSAALIFAAVLATPAMSRASHVTSRHRAEDANASTTAGARYVGEGNGFRAFGSGFGGTPGYGGYGNRHSGFRGGSRGERGRGCWGPRGRPQWAHDSDYLKWDGHDNWVLQQ